MINAQKWFIATLFGVGTTMIGLVWDAIIHSQDHAHLVTEALFNPGNPFANPGHLVFGIGLVLTTLAALTGFTEGWLAEGGRKMRWATVSVPIALWVVMGLGGAITLFALAQIG